VRSVVAVAASICLIAAPICAAAARDTRTEHVRFKEGRNSAEIKGTIVGYQSVAYLVGAEAGRTMTVTLKPSNLATYFNVYEPGKRPGDQALAASGLTGPMTPDLNKFSGKLRSSGEYTISVYMMRSAARRKERSNYTLSISISPLGDANHLPPVRSDFADGLQGGPDYWRVHAGKRDSVHLRVSPSSRDRARDKKLSDGTVLRNQGCRMMHGRRWCRVETVAAPRTAGWVDGRFLRESSSPGSVSRPWDAVVPGNEISRCWGCPLHPLCRPADDAMSFRRRTRRTGRRLGDDFLARWRQPRHSLQERGPGRL
jgi:hypothetical protein